MQVIWIPDNWDGKVRDDGVLKIQDDPYGIKGLEQFSTYLKVKFPLVIFYLMKKSRKKKYLKDG